MFRDIARIIFVLAAMFLAGGMMVAWNALDASNKTLSVLLFMLCAGILALLGFMFWTLEEK